MGDDELSLSVDDVLEVARGTRNFANSLAPKDTLKPAEVVPQALAALAQQPSVPGANAVITVHSRAHEVVTATLEGVKEDLLGFAQLLEASVDSIHESETIVEHALNINLTVPVGDDSLNGIGNGDAPTQAESRRQQALADGGEA